MTRVILLATDDGRDRPYTDAREATIEWAAGIGARVILYDRSAESYFVDPYASGTWTADVAGGPGPDEPLSPEQLRPLGRGYLADQVMAARSHGVDAAAWLPTRTGADGMRDAARRFGADLVVLPAAMAQPRLVDRVRGNTLERFREAIEAEVTTADRAGVAAASAASA